LLAFSKENFRVLGSTQHGILIALMTSVGFRSIVLYPKKNSSSLQVRAVIDVPNPSSSCDEMTSSASRANSIAVISATGEALTIFPPIVARLRIKVLANIVSNCSIPGTSCLTSSEAKKSLTVTAAPISSHFCPFSSK